MAEEKLESGRPLLEVEDLVKHFPVRKGVFSSLVGYVRAVDGVSFSLERGQTMSLVGESGSGKTTAARAILRLIEPTSGRVRFDGTGLRALKRREMRRIRREMQMIFQDPYGSLNPRMTVQAMLTEILRVHRLCARGERAKRVAELLELVGLAPESADRYPHEFSGGQRQRIGLARALAVEPSLVVADEPVSALDVSIQAQILNLLEELQERLGLTYLFIGHDLSVVRHISDEVGVMYLGRIVESGPVKKVFEEAVHPYTAALLSAVPVPRPGGRSKRILLEGDVPSPINPPGGCPFHPRCRHAQRECAAREQRLVEVSPGHKVACAVFAPPE